MRASKNESGFALILAILALMLMTFLGLSLVTATSTELQIATNYRWSQQALYNAEAGIEAAKIMLREMNWPAIVGPPRPAAITWDGATPPLSRGGTAPEPLARTDEWGNASRNFENWECDTRSNGVGYGVVLDGGGGTGPEQYRTTLLGSSLRGATTIWVRRPTWHNPDGTLKDLSDAEDPEGDSVLIVTAEGIAPYTGSTATLATTASNRAVQVVEVVLRAVVPGTTNPCSGGYAGQAGMGAEGANFGVCGAIVDGNSLPITGSGADTGAR